MYEFDSCKMHKADSIVKQHLRETSPNKMPLREETTLEIIKSGSLLGYDQCDIEVTENRRKLLPTFHPYSGTLLFVEMILIRLWEKIPRMKDSWHSPEEY